MEWTVKVAEANGRYFRDSVQITTTTVTPAEITPYQTGRHGKEENGTFNKLKGQIGF